MTMKRITVAQHERALVWKNKTFAGVLEPGKHWLIAPMSDIQAQLYDLTVPEFEHARVDFLVKEARETMQKYFDIVELTDSEAGLVYKNGKLAGVLAPGKRQLYWKGPIDVKVQKVDLTGDLEVAAPVAKLLARRVQTMEVSGQDILTKDKVSLRVNLTALWQVEDVVQARTQLQNFVEFVYKEL